MKNIVFSGIQPTNKLTIGNYIGAILNWIKIQNKYKCFFCIADLHSLTTLNNNKKLYSQSLDTLAIYLSCGINPDKNIIFIQSDVIEHTQLCWLLNCFTYFGELKRMTQFKQKISLNNINLNIGLFNYPILMAADILLYNADIVPIGQDQKQHLELTRNIAKRFNKIYGNIFNIPNSYISKNGSRIMSLLEPTKKMSKSDKNVNNVIYLLDNYNLVKKKIYKSVTDSLYPPKIIFNPIKQPGISNLLNILSKLDNISILKLEKKYNNKNYFELKKNVIKSINKLNIKLQKKYKLIRSNENLLKKILKKGAKKASIKAKKTLKKIKNAIGILNI